MSLPDAKIEPSSVQPSNRRPTSIGLEIKKLSTSRPDAPCQMSSTPIPSAT